MRRKVFTFAAAVSLVMCVGTVVAWVSDLRRGVVLRDGGGHALTCVLAWHDGTTGILWTHSALPFEGEGGLPDWLIVLVTAAFPVLWFAIRAAYRAPRATCISCGYSLTGNVSGVCPECGTPVAGKDEAKT